MSITTSEAIVILEDNFPQGYALIAGAALIFFEHVITFGQEVQLFWGKRSFSAWLFFANRMLALVYASISVWSVMNIHTVTSCMANFVANYVVNGLIAVISEVVTMLRVYAVTGGDRRPVMLLVLITVLTVVSGAYTEFAQTSYSVVILNRTAICTQSYDSSSAQDVTIKLGTANKVVGAAAAITTLAILWRKLYVDHRPAMADLLSARNPSLAALLLRDGTIQLTALLLLNLLLTVLTFVNTDAAYIIDNLQFSLASILISRVLLNIRAAARSTRGEQSQTPSFVRRSRRGVQTQADVENMSFELNVLNSTEQALSSDRSHPQESIDRDEIVAVPRSTANDVAAAGDSQQDVNEEEGMDEVEEELVSDWENDV